ncbi:MAG: hypothetical protein WC823_04190 [Parcubacteria group bacterium]|jgi:hypothetical protein
MISFSEATSLYFYSALLQGNAALITLVAMFLVYRKQYLDAIFDNLEKRTIDYLSKIANVATNYSDIFHFEKFNNELCKDLDSTSKEKFKNVTEHSSWIARFDELRDANKKRGELWQNAVMPIRLVFIILGASVIMLPLSDQIHVSAWLESLSFLVYVSSEIITLRLLFKFIKGQFV